MGAAREPRRRLMEVSRRAEPRRVRVEARRVEGRETEVDEKTAAAPRLGTRRQAKVARVEVASRVEAAKPAN